MKYLLIFPILLLGSCSHSDGEKENNEQNPDDKPVIQKRIIGRIASVSSTASFVLIQKYGTGTLPKEAVFQSQGTEGRQASLRPSGERVRDFFAADLLSGSVKIGDAVLAYHTPEKAESATEGETPPPSGDDTGGPENDPDSDE